MSQMHVEKFYMPITYCTCVQYIPMAGKFGRLLKLWRLAECTLVVEQVLAITIFIEKWLNECVGNLNRPWTSFDAVRTKLMMKCDWKLYKSMLYFIWTVYVASVFTVLFGSLFSCWQANSSPTSGAKTLWRQEVLVHSCQWWTLCRWLDLCV